MSILVDIRDMCKIYNPGENEVKALDHVELVIHEKEFVAIIGQSGSGKSTLMNMIGCLDIPTSGSYYLTCDLDAGDTAGCSIASSGRSLIETSMVALRLISL